MDQEIYVSTPESIEFSHEPAGLGSRFIASLIDTVFQSAIIMVIALVFGIRSPISGLGWSSVASVVLIFIVFWGYHIFFETIWNGQTPGKRAVGIRVLKDGGYPINFLDSVVRNLVRPVDFLPFFYGIGAIVVFCNSKFKRAGDFAAGTIVVKERKIEIPKPLNIQPIDFQEDLTIGGQTFNIYNFSESDINIVRQFMTRRYSMKKEARLTLAKTIARPFMKKLDVPAQLIYGCEEEFLEKLAKLYSNQ